MQVGLAVAGLIAFVALLLLIASEDAWWDGEDVE